MKQFDPKQVTVVLGGRTFGDWSDGGDVITLEPTGDAGAPTEGADGRGVFVHNPSRAHKLTLKIKQHSEDNRILNQWHALQRSNPKAFTPLTLTVRDLLNEDAATASNGMFQGAPKLVRGNGHNGMEWSIWFETGSITLEKGLGH
jgi:hypothetical protein